MSAPQPQPDWADPAFRRWLAAARSRAQQRPPERQPLLVAGHHVGSVAPGFLDSIGRVHRNSLRHRLLPGAHLGAPAWHLDSGPEAATRALNDLAALLRQLRLCGPWRNEQLAVCNAQGLQIASVERGAVHVLGIATRAVHLVGCARAGRIWVQQRAADKAQDPNLWDTLMGGMLAAGDTLEQALERETWEEAGLPLAALGGLTYGGQLLIERPSADGSGAGHMRERIDWFHATLADCRRPCNRDGEVQRFALLDAATLRQWLLQQRFTLEAALVLAAFLGC